MSQKSETKQEGQNATANTENVRCETSRSLFFPHLPPTPENTHLIKQGTKDVLFATLHFSI